MLQLEIAFPSGRYYAASHDDPSVAEWPPSPSRALSALVAAGYRRPEGMTATQRSALSMLEALPAPRIWCPDADIAKSPERYVPVNDIETRRDLKKPYHPAYPRHVGRHFPAAFLLGEPRVRFGWSYDPPEELLAELDELAVNTTYVGTSQSLAVARFSRVADIADADWIPDDQAVEFFLRVPQAGRLQELDELFSEPERLLRRPLPRYETLQGYRSNQVDVAAPWQAPYRWQVMRLGQASWGVDVAETFARALRSAVMSRLGDEAMPEVHGHQVNTVHIAWLPLADVGHVHADGRIRGVAVAIPVTMPAPSRQVLLSVLRDIHTLRLPGGQCVELDIPQFGDPLPNVLRQSCWCGSVAGERMWSTVTPVLLDRPPKHKSEQNFANAVSQSLVNAGYPPPESVAVMAGSDFIGAPASVRVPSSIPRCHARITFAEPVFGPVLAGRGRHFGVGLFRPTPVELR